MAPEAGEGLDFALDAETETAEDETQSLDFSLDLDSSPEDEVASVADDDGLDFALDIDGAGEESPEPASAKYNPMKPTILSLTLERKTPPSQA